MQLLLFIFGLILFTGLVVVHELGHWWVAKRNGVESEEFGIGLPPRAWGKKLKSGLTLSLNWLPIGGFVKLKGESDSDVHPGSFGAASLGAKVKIILAGVTANLIVGLLLLTLLALVGMPKLITQATVGQDQFTVASDTEVTQQLVIAGFIQPDSPAEDAGLNSRDIILQLKRSDEVRNVNSAKQLQAATHNFANSQVKLTYKRSGQILSSQVQLRGIEQAPLGISPQELQIRRSSWSAPIVALGFTKQLVELTIKGIGNALAGLGSIIAGLITGNEQARQAGHSRATEQIGGPVAIGAILWGSGTFGLNFVLMIIAVISLTLALINVLPIPALDGGRLTMILFARGILKRPLSRQVEETIIGFSMILILILIALITIVDVRRFL